MMLIRADPVTKTISMLSFPRDLHRPDLLPAPDGGGADGPATVIGTGRIN